MDLESNRVLWTKLRKFFCIFSLFSVVFYCYVCVFLTTWRLWKADDAIHSSAWINSHSCALLFSLILFFVCMIGHFVGVACSVLVNYWPAVFSTRCCRRWWILLLGWYIPRWGTTTSRHSSHNCTGWRCQSELSSSWLFWCTDAYTRQLGCILLRNSISHLQSRPVIVSALLHHHRLWSDTPVFNHWRSSFSGRCCLTLEHSATERHVGTVTDCIWETAQNLIFSNVPSFSFSLLSLLTVSHQFLFCNFIFVIVLLVCKCICCKRYRYNKFFFCLFCLSDSYYVSDCNTFHNYDDNQFFVSNIVGIAMAYTYIHILY